MRIYKETNVFEEALNRIRYLYDEFDDIYVTHSGGKDSTVIYHLCKIVAEEKNRLPLKVMFLDQEAEYAHTIEVIKDIMYDKDVEPYWIQVPIRLFNATSTQNEWLNCWNEDDKENWMRPKDPIAYKENVWGTEKFHNFFSKFLEVESRGRKICGISGVRTAESFSRYTGLTQDATYKWITWGKKHGKNKNIFTFHPIYDWQLTDVWKAIHDNGWKYNKIYDYQYQHGVNLSNMRVSNLHHETAIQHLFFLQEVEPDTYERLTRRLDGIDTAGKLGTDDYYIKDLPYMFKDWFEYRDFLLEKLVDDDKKDIFRKHFEKSEAKFGEVIPDYQMGPTHINIILSNDYHGTKLQSAHSRWNLKLRDKKRERKKKRNAMARRKARRSGQ